MYPEFNRALNPWPPDHDSSLLTCFLFLFLIFWCWHIFLFHFILITVRVRGILLPSILCLETILNVPFSILTSVIPSTCSVFHRVGTPSWIMSNTLRRIQCIFSYLSESECTLCLFRREAVWTRLAQGSSCYITARFIRLGIKLRISWYLVLPPINWATDFHVSLTLFVTFHQELRGSKQTRPECYLCHLAALNYCNHSSEYYTSLRFCRRTFAIFSSNDVTSVLDLAVSVAS